MPHFPAEIISKIVEQVNFDPECLETFKEDIRIFNVLNSVNSLKPIISKCMSIWIMYPEEIHFNFLKSSQTLRDLRNCTDSFFIITTDSPTEMGLITSKSYGEAPLVFDVHNFLGLETPQSSLSLGIDQDTLLEKLVLLSEKRPKRIIELTLPGGFRQTGIAPWTRITKSYRNSFDSKVTDSLRLKYYRRITGTFADFNKEFDVLIDHKTIHMFPISEYDEYDFDDKYGSSNRRSECVQVRWMTSLLTVPTKFWGSTPILNEISICKLKEIAVTEKFKHSWRNSRVARLFLESFQRSRDVRWTDYQRQLFNSEYFRINRASYYYLIETLSSKKWE